MQIILFTANDCSICHDAEEKFKARFKEELASGEAEVVNLEESDEAMATWAKNERPVFLERVKNGREPR